MIKNIKIVIPINIFFIFYYFLTPCFSISAAVKTEMDYKSLLQKLRFSTIATENFADEGQKKKFEEIKALFRDASAEYYGQRYEIAYTKFYKVKEDLFTLLDTITLLYLKRSKEILDSTAKTAFDIIIKYAKNTTFSNNFKYPFDPIENKRNYDEKEYHFYYDRTKIENYLYDGYKKLSLANDTYNDPDFKYLKDKKKKTTKDLDSILDQCASVISLCRQTKTYGIEIYKIFNDDKTGDILIRYKISGDQIDPAIDSRIPDAYKIDAVDNERKIFSGKNSINNSKKE